MQLQHWTLKLTRELDRMSAGAAAHIMRVGRRGGAARFAAMTLSARRRTAKQAQMLLESVEQAMSAGAPFKNMPALSSA
jgi:hypothetical protein